MGEQGGPATRRVGIYVDVENLLHGYRQQGDWQNGIRLARRLVEESSCLGMLVAAVACCDSALWRLVAFPLAELGFRVFSHSGGADAADRELVRRLETEVPSSVDTVVIGSGDHIFAPTVRALHVQGRRVLVAVGAPNSLAHALRLEADETRVFMYPAPRHVAA